MKNRFTAAALAALTFAAPMAVATEAAAQNRGDRHWDDDDDDRRDWRRDRHGDRRDWRRDRREDRRDARRDRREARREARWNRRHYNGYWHSGRWYYGPPPSYYEYDDVRYEWRHWRRGERLPRYYRDYYDEIDWRDYRLRQPPRGYHYVRDDRGDYLLVGIATGVILGVILANR